MLDRFIKHKIFSYIYTPLIFLLACFVVIKNWEVNGTILFAYIASVMLIISSRLTNAMLPVMLLCVFVTRCYDSADIFLGKAMFFAPVIIAVATHFVIYRKKYIDNLRIGRSFFGLCAVTLAVTLGGIGTISASEYFAGAALYHVLGLGIGMIIFYLILKADITDGSSEDITKIMYIVGLFACFCVLRFYIADWNVFVETKKIIAFQSSNNLATFLMLAMPFPLFYAYKRYVDIISVFLIYGCIFLTGSRGGLLMGSLEFVLIFIAFTIFDKRVINKIIYGSIALLFVITVVLCIPFYAEFYNIGFDTSDAHPSFSEYISAFKNYFIKDGEPRVNLLDRMTTDFKSNPIFGVGLGYTGNSDIYSPVKGAMNWYHMWFAQIIGGLGGYI